MRIHKKRLICFYKDFFFFLFIFLNRDKFASSKSPVNANSFSRTIEGSIVQPIKPKQRMRTSSMPAENRKVIIFIY